MKRKNKKKEENELNLPTRICFRQQQRRSYSEIYSYREGQVFFQQRYSYGKTLSDDKISQDNKPNPVDIANIGTMTKNQDIEKYTLCCILFCKFSSG